MTTLKDYYRLTKPGIVYGNTLTTIAAFLFATRFRPELWHEAGTPALFLASVAGLALVVASACVFNNWLDRDLDRKMARTKERALAAGRISVPAALVYGALLGLAGFVLLIAYANLVAAGAALLGWIAYVFAYTFIKRVSPWGALVGTVPGAMPIVVGYAAVMGRLDLAALLLFLLMVAWQMPHFYAIAIFRRDEYAEAGLPVLPRVKGVRATKMHIIAHMALFIAAVATFYAYGFAGAVFLVVMLVLGVVWLIRGVAGLGLAQARDAAWARGVFGFSLIVLLALCALLALTPWLP